MIEIKGTTKNLSILRIIYGITLFSIKWMVSMIVLPFLVAFPYIYFVMVKDNYKDIVEGVILVLTSYFNKINCIDKKLWERLGNHNQT